MRTENINLVKFCKMYHTEVIKLLTLLLVSIIHNESVEIVNCQPLLLDPTAVAASGQMLAMPVISPMIYGPQLDPYSSMQMPQFLMAAPYGGVMHHPNLMPYQDTAGKRSAGPRNAIFPSRTSSKNNERAHVNDQPEDQKAMEDLPINFIDDPPSTFTERLSESFSAIGEGVKNHFKSISENFSDTVDYIKDTWRSPNSSNRASMVEHLS